MSLLPLALWFLLGPAESPQGKSTEALELAIGSAKPSVDSADQLASALTEAETRALEFVDDESALETLDRARLVLASIHLALGNNAKAEAAMDEAIRSAMGRDIAAGSFGPAILELYRKRHQLLQEKGKATISITCSGCEIVINETRTTDPDTSLYLGSYRVLVSFADPAQKPERFEIELLEPDSVVRRDFSGEIIQQPATDLGHAEPPHRKRLLPRWAELTGISAGAALLVGGVILAALNDKCKGDAFGGNPNTCPELYENRPQDMALIGVGVGIIAATGVVLTVDEVRVGRARGHQAMLTWMIQF